MASITPFGMLHTAISALAVCCGIASLVLDRKIGLRTRLGASYIVLTAASCVSGLFIFHHGGFGPPHVLSLLTLVLLAYAVIAEERARGLASPGRMPVAAYTATLFLHFIPGLTETMTRLPTDGPLATGPQDPILIGSIGLVFLIFLVVGFLQWKALPKFQTTGDSSDGDLSAS